MRLANDNRHSPLFSLRSEQTCLRIDTSQRDVAQAENTMRAATLESRHAELGVLRSFSRLRVRNG